MTSTLSPATATAETDEYNYRRFRASSYDLSRFDGPSVGQPMPDLELHDLEGQPHRLSDYAGETVVVETGSVTCPMYAKGIPAMKRLAAGHPDTRFITIYVREAHPGERVGPHRSEAEKQARAATAPSLLGDNRLILVDDLAGTVHHQLGLLPNMVYVMDGDGRVMFRGDWTDPEAVESILTDPTGSPMIRKEHFPPAKPSPRTAVSTLLIGGWKALFDFVIGLPGLMAQHRRADRQAEGVQRQP